MSDCHHGVTTALHRTGTAAVNRLVSRSGYPAIGSTVQYRRETNLKTGGSRILRIPFQPLAGTRDEITVTAGSIQAIDEFQQHVMMPLVGGMRGDKTLGDTDQTEQPAMLVIQIDQLDHHLGRLTGGVLELAEFGFEARRLLTDSIDLTFGLGLGRRLGVLGENHTGQSGHDDNRDQSSPLSSSPVHRSTGPSRFRFACHRPTLSCVSPLGLFNSSIAACTPRATWDHGFLNATVPLHQQPPWQPPWWLPPRKRVPPAWVG